MTPIKAYFHPDQLKFRPLYEWAFGQRIDHPETTARADAIVAALALDSRFALKEPTAIDDSVLDLVHDPSLRVLYETARSLPPDEDLYPHVFPREYKGNPRDLLHAGAFCFDAGTPINRHTADAARWSAASAFAAARDVLSGQSLSYALSRPPGHHAEESMFGGYCYYNNAGIAAQVLRERGRVAILDIDFHHGNGSQSRFYGDPDVFVASIHGDPRHYFPFYCGFAHETGKGDGTGFNRNVVLPARTTLDTYIKSLDGMLEVLEQWKPQTLVLSAGLDTYTLDPIGDFDLTTDDYHTIGSRIAQLKVPVVAIQEGGYFTQHLGRNLVALLGGLIDGGLGG
jgi:acetoin utilization deacetylase AcuC-like enzyme